MFSTLSGDRTFGFVYMSICNLPIEKERAVKCNGLILLGPLSRVPYNPAWATMRKIFHYAIYQMLSPFENAGREVMDVVCADLYTGILFRRIVTWTTDYLEIVTLTFVNSMCCPPWECPLDQLSTLTGTKHISQMPPVILDWLYLSLRLSVSWDLGLKILLPTMSIGTAITPWILIDYNNYSKVFWCITRRSGFAHILWWCEFSEWEMRTEDVVRSSWGLWKKLRSGGSWRFLGNVVEDILGRTVVVIFLRENLSPNYRKPNFA